MEPCASDLQLRDSSSELEGESRLPSNCGNVITVPDRQP